MAMSEYMQSLRAVVGHRLLELPSVTILVRDEQDHLLLVRQSDPPIWSTPGGAIEPGEVPADAAVREVWEETGLQVDLTHLVGAFGGPEFVTEYSNGDRVSYVMIVFEAVRISGELRVDDDEVLELRFFSSDDLESIAIPEWLREVLSGVPFRSSVWRPPGVV
jgi:8-oxo-dGTP pyrophosphatase MutT (NUDIX family)